MKTYQLRALISEMIKGKDLDELIKKLEKTLTDNKCSQIQTSESTVIKLAYPIKKNDVVNSLSVNFETKPKNVLKIKNVLSKTPAILRTIIVSYQISKTTLQKSVLKSTKTAADTSKTKTIKIKQKTKKAVKKNKKTKIQKKTIVKKAISKTKKAIVKKTNLKKDIKKSKKEISQEIDSDNERIKKLDEKLGEILKE